MTNVAGETSIGTILREFQVATVHEDLKGQYHAVFSNTLKIKKMLFG